jgi:hypothetical protein
MSTASQIPPIPTQSNVGPPPKPQQGLNLESELLENVAELQQQNCVHGLAVSVEDLVNLHLKNLVDDDEFLFEGGDKEIIARVLASESLQQGKIVDVHAASEEEDSEEEEEEEEEEVPKPTNQQLQNACKMLEDACMSSMYLHGVDLAQLLRCFCSELVREELAKAKQTTLDAFVTHKQ